MRENIRKTPIMGWASWNCYRTHISEEIMKKQADALVETGLAACGYEYFNMDDGFFGGRGEDGRLRFHQERFPNGIKVIADYAHSLGLKAGVYSEAGDKTCGFYWDNEGADGDGVGLYGYEEQDLSMFLEEYGFDFIKIDWCGGLNMGLDEQAQYTKIGRIIDTIRERTGRTIVWNLCRWQFPGPWAVELADSWRTGSDINPDFASVMHQIDNIKPLAGYCSPGHVNDLDMMELGNGLSYEEEKTHFTMWCMMSSPLLIGCDLTAISEDTLRILKNKELIAVNQDAACLQAYVVKEIGSGEVWIKDLGQKDSREKAVVFLNRGEEPLEMTAAMTEIGLAGAVKQIRDLWKHEDLELCDPISVTVQPHEAIAYRILCEDSCTAENLHQEEELATRQTETIITKADAMQMEAVIVDVGTKEEYEAVHLEGALHIPYTKIHSQAKRCIPDKKYPVIVYCSTGKRSSQAAKSLIYLGYREVYRIQ